MIHRLQRPGCFDLLALHERNPGRYPFLLQSMAGQPQSGRYDLLFAFPEWQSPQTLTAGEGNWFAQLSTTVAQEALLAETPLPFCGGWFLLLGYEAARFIEPQLRLPPSPHALPDAIAVRCPAALIVDHELGCTHLLSERSEAQLAHLLADCVAVENQTGVMPASDPLVDAVVEDDPADYLAGVARVLDYLRSGDSFQINLSRAWRAKLKQNVNYLALYRGLRASNPAPFAGLACIGSSVVLSSSPERLIQLKKTAAGTVAQTRPIAGTRARGKSAAEDAALCGQLLGSLKERAEHVMLIDLERNDLGRVCEPGSVAVSELMTVESYAHVHHIVSNVQGRLKAGVGPGEAIAAVFPGGTITGCPKVRAMEIIAELETVGRGPYTGAMGYLSRDGQLDLNILIRSLVVENGTVTLRAGAGIVADSIAEAELAETRTKAKGLLRALGIAGNDR